MKQVKTAKGRILDMGALAKMNEEARAVGNVRMNAKGDRLDPSGNVIATVQRVARTQAELAQAPEKRNMSETPNTGKKPIKATKKPEPKRKSVIMSEETKTRKDGSTYIEIEYDDGSIDIKEKQQCARYTLNKSLIAYSNLKHKIFYRDISELYHAKSALETTCRPTQAEAINWCKENEKEMDKFK